MKHASLVSRRDSGEIVLGLSPEEDFKFYEVIVKFHPDGRELVETFLRANMARVTVSKTLNPDVLLAYCLFYGDVKRLDRTLAALRQSAMVILGDKRENFLDLFVALRPGAQESRESPEPSTPPRGFRLRNLPAGKWLGGFLLGLAVAFLWQGYGALSAKLSRIVHSPSPFSASATEAVPEWSAYISPEFHGAWLAVQRAHGLTDGSMIDLFRRIKAIELYDPGHPFRDLTIYPQGVNRALNLIILEDITGPSALQAAVKELEGRFAHWRPFPDRRRGSGRMALSDPGSVTQDNVVLVFFHELLNPRNKQFSEGLIGELRRFHLAKNTG